MSYQHRLLAAGRWKQFSFLEQMAHVGSEVERALQWRARQHAPYGDQAAERALELLDLTLDAGHSFPRLKEASRLREALVDYFFGTNQFQSTEASWRAYFSSFASAARQQY
jgi:hypothetical protein